VRIQRPVILTGKLRLQRFQTSGAQLFHDETLIFRLIRALIFRVGQNDYNQMNDATRSHYIEVLERGHYRQIFGYPSALYLPVQRLAPGNAGRSHE